MDHPCTAYSTSAPPHPSTHRDGEHGEAAVLDLGGLHRLLVALGLQARQGKEEKKDKKEEKNEDMETKKGAPQKRGKSISPW